MGRRGCDSQPLSPCPAFISTAPQGISSKFGPAHKKDSPGSLEGTMENTLEFRSNSPALVCSAELMQLTIPFLHRTTPPPPRPHASQDPSPLAPHPLLKKKKPLDHSRFWSCLEKQGVCSHGFCPGCPTAPALHGIDGGGWGEGGDGRMGEEPGAGAGPSWEPRTLFLSCSFGS